MAIHAANFRELRIDRLSRAFGALAALKEVNLTIRQGEFIALLGPSGCGKSTALNIFAGLLPSPAAASGSTSAASTGCAPEERGFGMVFQNYALFPHMSVRKNIGFGLMMRGVPKAEAERRIDEAIGSCASEARSTSCRASFGRPAAARRHRARHRGRAAAGADGRAALQPRRQAPA